MATKSTLISNINGFITSVVNITKHRNSMLELVNELFQTTTTQSGTTGVLSLDLEHNLRYKKIGNIVYIDGTIKNTSSFVYSNIILLTIPNSQYYPKTDQITQLICNSSSGNSVGIEFALSSINLTSPLVPNQTIIINGHYQTND
jgi:hypothetical protein